MEILGICSRYCCGLYAGKVLVIVHKQIVIFPSNEMKEVSLDMLSELHQGEIETIKIALQLSADYVFIDD